MPHPRLVLKLLFLSALTMGCQSLAGPAQTAAPGGAGFAALLGPDWGGALRAILPAAILEDDAEDEGDGLLYGVLVYLPNRILDVFDIVRARARIGPGFAIGARATEAADVFVGTYASVYVGLPGPRGRVIPRLPAGLESKSGIEISAADVTLEAGLGPDYGLAECGFGFQLGIIGVDIGVDPWEILDLVVGLVTIDIADDDF